MSPATTPKAATASTAPGSSKRKQHRYRLHPQSPQPGVSTNTGAASGKRQPAGHQQEPISISKMAGPMPRMVVCCLPWKWVFLLILLLYSAIVMFTYTQVSGLDHGKHTTETFLGSIRDQWAESLQSSYLQGGGGGSSPPPHWQTHAPEWYQGILHKMEEAVGKTKDGAGLMSCRRYQNNNDKQGSLAFSSDPLHACRDNNNKQKGPFYYYNPLPKQSRIVCGQTIAPKGFLKRDKLCLAEDHTSSSLSSHLFPVLPNETGQGMPAIVTRWEGQKGHARPFEQCDIPCHEVGEFRSLVTTKFIDGTDWKITFSMEGPQYYPKLQKDPNDWKRNEFYSTTPFTSEIPLPYYSEAEYDIFHRKDTAKNKPVDFDKGIRGAVFMARNCNSKNHREGKLKELMKLSEKSKAQRDGFFRVDSVSSCMHTADVPPGSTLKDKKSVLMHYLFYFAFENQCEDSYITEKLYGPYEAGSIPVYYGASDVQKFAPKHSMILVEDFSSTEALFRYLQKVASNKTLYMEYHAWRQKPQPEFDTNMNFTRVHGTCRTCRWAYARMHGLGWNHEQQRVEDLRIAGSRNACVDGASGLLQSPVVEVWKNATTMQQIGDAKPSKSQESGCLQGNAAQQEISLLEGQFVRKVRQVDGVVDIEVYPLSSEAKLPKGLLLQLLTKLPSSSSITSKRVEAGNFRLQNEASRVTILTWPKEVLVSAEGSILNIPSNTFPLKIRVISEDIDTFHFEADQSENYFGQVMRKDFYYPVEVFYKS